MKYEKWKRIDLLMRFIADFFSSGDEERNDV